MTTRRRVYSIDEWDAEAANRKEAAVLFIHRLLEELVDGTDGEPWSALDCRCRDDGADCGCEKECA